MKKKVGIGVGIFVVLAIVVVVVLEFFVGNDPRAQAVLLAQGDESKIMGTIYIEQVSKN